MALSNPRLRSEFWEELGISGLEGFHLDQADSVDRTASGDPALSRQGWQKWRARVTVKAAYHAQALKVEGLLRGLRGSMVSFYAYDLRQKYPKDDPDGSRLAGRNVTIKSIGTNNRSVALDDVPNNFSLSIGEKLSVTWGDNRKLLLEACEFIDSGSSGSDTAEFEVQPFLPSGLQVGDAVTLIRPFGEFIITPGSLPARVSATKISEGLSFDIEEV